MRTMAIKSPRGSTTEIESFMPSSSALAFAACNTRSASARVNVAILLTSSCCESWREERASTRQLREPITFLGYEPCPFPCGPP